MKYGLLGERLSHSHSPKIHTLLGNKDYSLIEKGESEVKAFLRERDFDGINVTIPYKQAVIPLCDFVDGAALKIGAVNTVVNRNGKLFGYNTDIDGFIFMCRCANIDMQCKKVLILGSGGTSLTAKAAAEKLGAKEIAIVARNGSINYDNIYERASDSEIIINTTPVGMYPHNDGKLIELKKFPYLTGLCDVIYNPMRTRLLSEAKELGIPHTGGLTMLVAQAAFADKHFRGITHGENEIIEIANRVKKDLENIVLIGMPGCGKSTVGEYIAKELGRKLADTDTETIAREGMPIPEIFAKKGEEYFREAESCVVKDISKESGIVIACGGGTVLREENRTALSQNGRIFYIKRELEKLDKKGRPLSSGENSIEKLYSVRKPIYEGFADIIIEPCENVESCAKAIIKEFEK